MSRFLRRVGRLCAAGLVALEPIRARVLPLAQHDLPRHLRGIEQRDVTAGDGAPINGVAGCGRAQKCRKQKCEYDGVLHGINQKRLQFEKRYFERAEELGLEGCPIQLGRVPPCDEMAKDHF